MKLILSIYDNGVVIHMKVCQDILTDELLPFDCLNLNNLFHPQPYPSKQLIEVHVIYSEYI